MLIECGSAASVEVLRHETSHLEKACRCLGEHKADVGECLGRTARKRVLELVRGCFQRAGCLTGRGKVWPGPVPSAYKTPSPL